MDASSIQLQRIHSTLAIQFPGLDLDQLAEKFSVEVSRKTGRIKGVYDALTQERLFSLRTSDGRLLPTFAGGKRMIAQNYRNNRIVMNKDAAPFIASGKSAFCKHVVRCDDNIVPESEVLLTDESEQLLAVGTAQQPGYIINLLTSGVAAKVKHSRD